MSKKYNLRDFDLKKEFKVYCTSNYTADPVFNEIAEAFEKDFDVKKVEIYTCRDIFPPFLRYVLLKVTCRRKFVQQPLKLNPIDASDLISKEGTERLRQEIAERRKRWGFVSL